MGTLDLARILLNPTVDILDAVSRFVDESRLLHWCLHRGFAILQCQVGPRRPKTLRSRLNASSTLSLVGCEDQGRRLFQYQ